MPEIFSVVQTEAINLANNIRANLFRTNTSATGKTGQSLRIDIKQEGTKIRFQLFGRPFFMTVQTGRRPTPEKKPSREMISNLTEWMEARNMDVTKVWAVATNIQKRGTQLWREGGRNDIVDPAVDQFVNDVSQAALEAEADNFVLKIRSMEW